MGVGSQQSDFAEFYRGSKDECLFTVLVSVGDLDAAQELVAEAFARAWASWPKVSKHPAPVAWIVRTALNANVSRWRRRRREVSVADPAAIADLTAAHGHGPPMAVIARDAYSQHEGQTAPERPYPSALTCLSGAAQSRKVALQRGGTGRGRTLG